MKFREGWLKENITSVLAIMWSVFAFVILMVVLTKEIKSDDKTVYLIIGGVFGIINFVIGYYYGASKSKPSDNINKNEIKDPSVTEETIISKTKTESK